MAVVATFATVGFARWPTNILGDPMIVWVFASKDACPGGAAYLAAGITSGKLHPLVGNAVNIWSFVKGGPFVGEVASTEVVHENENNIGLTGE